MIISSRPVSFLEYHAPPLWQAQITYLIHQHRYIVLFYTIDIPICRIGTVCNNNKKLLGSTNQTQVIPVERLGIQASFFSLLTLCIRNTKEEEEVNNSNISNITEMQPRSHLLYLGGIYSTYTRRCGGTPTWQKSMNIYTTIPPSFTLPKHIS